MSESEKKKKLRVFLKTKSTIIAHDVLEYQVIDVSRLNAGDLPLSAARDVPVGAACTAAYDVAHRLEVAKAELRDSSRLFQSQAGDILEATEEGRGCLELHGAAVDCLKVCDAVTQMVDGLERARKDLVDLLVHHDPERETCRLEDDEAVPLAAGEATGGSASASAAPAASAAEWETSTPAQAPTDRPTHPPIHPPTHPPTDPPTHPHTHRAPASDPSRRSPSPSQGRSPSRTRGSHSCGAGRWRGSVLGGHGTRGCGRRAREDKGVRGPGAAKKPREPEEKEEVCLLVDSEAEEQLAGPEVHGPATDHLPRAGQAEACAEWGSGHEEGDRPQEAKELVEAVAELQEAEQLVQAAESEAGDQLVKMEEQAEEQLVKMEGNEEPLPLPDHAKKIFELIKDLMAVNTNKAVQPYKSLLLAISVEVERLGEPSLRSCARELLRPVLENPRFKSNTVSTWRGIVVAFAAQLREEVAAYGVEVDLPVFRRARGSKRKRSHAAKEEPIKDEEELDTKTAGLSPAPTQAEEEAPSSGEEPLSLLLEEAMDKVEGAGRELPTPSRARNQHFGVKSEGDV